MGTVVTVMNMKGGVGKTTVVMNLGGLLGTFAIGGKARKVLLIDYDPQFNLSQAYIDAQKYYELEQGRRTTLAILQDDDTALDPYVLQVPGNSRPPAVSQLAFSIEAGDNRLLDLIPATLDLMYIALGHSEVKTKPIEERFAHFIADCRDAYDVVFIDCHPAGSLFTKTSLQNSDHVLIPVAPDRFALRGIGLMMRFIIAQKRGVASPKPHILFNMTQPGVVSPTERAVREHKDFKDHCLIATLRRFKAYSDPLDGSGFVWWSTKPWSTEAFNRLRTVANEFVTRIGV